MKKSEKKVSFLITFTIFTHFLCPEQVEVPSKVHEEEDESTC